MLSFATLFFFVFIYSLTNMLRSFPGPTLIVNGENDKQNRKREDALLRAAQNCKLQVVKQAGHLCNLEQPVAFAHLVRTFAKRLNVASRR